LIKQSQAKKYLNVRVQLAPISKWNIINHRLTFLAQWVRMRPNFQEPPWFECDGLGGDELLARICWTDNLENLLWFYFQSMGANILQFFIAYDKRSTYHSLT